MRTILILLGVMLMPWLDDMNAMSGAIAQHGPQGQQAQAPPMPPRPAEEVQNVSALPSDTYTLYQLTRLSDDAWPSATRPRRTRTDATLGPITKAWIVVSAISWGPGLLFIILKKYVQ